MCSLLEINRSSYSKRKEYKQRKRYQENQILLKMIKEIFEVSKQRYGSPRITAELNKRGIKCNKKRIARLMAQNGIQAKIFMKYRITTNSNHVKEKSVNLLNQEFIRKSPNEVWSKRYNIYTNRTGMALFSCCN